MSQKTDPTSLRLQKTNKNFSSSWYSDSFYSQMILSDLKARSYIESLSEQMGRAQMFLYTQRYYKRAYAYLFFLDAREIRSQREKVLRTPKGVLSRKGQKGARSITASIAFVSSCFGFDYKSDLKEENNCLGWSNLFRDSVTSSALFPMLQHLTIENCDGAKRDLAHANLFRGHPVPVDEIPLTGQGTDTQSNINRLKTQIPSTNSKSLYSYWWLCSKVFAAKQGTNSVNQLPLSQSGLTSQASFFTTAFNCSMFRDLIVQNCKKSNRNVKLPTPPTGEGLFSLPGFGVRSGFGTQDLCAVEETSLQQRALYSCAQKDGVMLNMFHRTVEAAFRLDYHFSNRLAKAAVLRHSKCANNASFTALRSLTSREASTKPRFAVFCPIPKEITTAVQSKLPSTPVQHTHQYPHQTSNSRSVVFQHSHSSTKENRTPLQVNSVLTSLYPIRVVQDIQFVCFFAQEIAHLLQRGASFKQVQNRVLNEHQRNEIIKGIRLSCSGRIGGRSKKAQKSKTQSVQCGETSLHVLSSKLSFASKSANTSFGKIGIKLWLCFR